MPKPHTSTMPSSMAGVALSVLLATAALQQAQAAPWVPDWLSASPLDSIQRLVQQRQQRKLQNSPTLSAVAAAVPSEQLVAAPLGMQLQEAGEQEATAGSYGNYGYGYGEYGYGYGGYAYGDSEPAIELAFGSQGLQEAVQQPGLAPTLVYNEPQQPAAAAAAAVAPISSSGTGRRLSQVIEAGMAHADGIELSDVAAAAVVPAVSFELPSERRAARKLLLSASKISVDALEAAVAPVALALELDDALLPGSGRALLGMGEGSYGGSYGGYGEYGYGDYGYGGYGSYGDAAAAAESMPASGRALLAAAEDDDVSLYQVWLANHNVRR
ncbi:hypothetical protein OEZ85_008568 [Tetradesmus obliquus]|uniref:Uncharacterized protein n=1 Tax=Tetradesmus obliquus TaxID=3088 RepID=A0ABY8TJ72_TETOB|nr:hypothetical protein OEZ85_008568 [Tetradesmus obliquus]